VAVSVIAAASILVTAGGSVAAPGIKGFVCPSIALKGGRGNQCADLAMTLTHEPARVEIGRPFKAKMSVHNFGPSFASSVTAADTLPTSMTFVSYSAPGGVSCTTPAVGHTGVVNCMLGGMNSGATVLIVVKTRPTASGLKNNQASTSSPTQDPSPGNNSRSDMIDVQTNTRGCTLIGTIGDDTIDGTDEADVICGLAGADHIDGKGSDDVVFGEKGADVISDHTGTDQLLGGPGGDSLDSADGTGGDTVKGNAGVNTCTVDAGDTASQC
jgi:uncharacterized repeat protein (TIGR01451 family)